MDGRGWAAFAHYAPPRASLAELPSGTVMFLLTDVEDTTALLERTVSYALHVLETA
jgi:hypothetical protein